MGFDILGGVGSLLNTVDIGGKLVDVAANALGLPPEVTNIAKAGIGVATGNPIMAANGAVGLVGNVLDKAAETEYAPGSTKPGSGYAGHCGSEPPKGYFPLGSPNTGVLGGIFDIFKGLNEIDRTIGEKVGGFFLDGKHEEGFKNINNLIHGQNLQFAAVVLGMPQGKAAFEKAFACKVDPSSLPMGQLGFQGDYSADWKNPRSPLDPNIVQYREAIDVLRANWATFDTAATKRDGFVQRADIEAIANNPNASEVMRNAAQFLIDNPEYFNRLEMAAGIGGKDGTIGFPDLTAEVKRVNAEIKQYGLPETAGGRATGKTVYEDKSSPVSGGGSKLGGILNDPTMTLEEKLHALMDAITADLDAELGDTMNDLEKAMSKKPKDGDNNAAQAKQTSIDQITRKLQQLMERRKQMTELATNMSKNFNDMAMSAIRNMR